MYTAILCVIIVVPLTAEGAVPGTFFWRPRLGLDFSLPTTEIALKAQVPSIENIQAGLVVMIDGYQMGMTVLALVAGISASKQFPHLNPLSGYYYTNVYRWALRYLNLLPPWLGGNGGSYCDTHKVWRRRFFYMDEFVPDWLKKLLPFVDEEEWKKEKWEFKRFIKLAEPAFGKHYRYPSKHFNNFESENTRETVENLDSSGSLNINKY